MKTPQHSSPPPDRFVPFPGPVRDIRGLADVAALSGEICALLADGRPSVPVPRCSIGDALIVAADAGRLSPSEAFAIAFSMEQHRVETGDCSPATVEKYGALAIRLVAFIESRGVTDIRAVDRRLLVEWIHAPRRGYESRAVAPSTRDNRHWAVDRFFTTLRALALFDGDPLLDLSRPGRPDRVGRPLTDEELAECRRHARGHVRDTLGPVRLALSTASATAGEVAAVVVADYDPNVQSIWLPGRAKYWVPRWAPLRHWEADAIERRIAALSDPGPDTPIAITSTRGRRPAPAVSAALRKILNRSGLANDPLVLPGSFRAWGARQIYDETYDLELVAQRLGVRSLKSAREAIGLPPREPDEPPAHRRPQ